MNALNLRFRIASALFAAVCFGLFGQSLHCNGAAANEAAGAIGQAAQAAVDTAEMAADVASFLPGSFK
jgi:hypothetical protein